MPRRFGLIGHPLKGSGSPALFGSYVSSRGIRASYDLIDEPDFDKAWQTFLDGYEAVNVTAPFKTLACRRADILSPECEKTGAANILVKTPDGIKAYNSDYLGVLSLLRSRFPSLRPMGKCEFIEQMYTLRPASFLPEGTGPDQDSSAGNASALVIGCGGAGKAAVCAALDAGFATVTLANRTLSAATQFSFDTARWYNGRIRLTSLDQIGESRYDLAIFALPCHIPQADGIDAGVILEANYRTPCLAPAGISAGGTSGAIDHAPYLAPGSIGAGGTSGVIDHAPCLAPAGIGAGETSGAIGHAPCLAPGSNCPYESDVHGRYIHGSEWLSAQAQEGYPLMLGL